MEIRVDALLRSDWETLADQGQALLQQRWDYGAAVQAHGRKCARLVVEQHGQPVAIAQVFHRSFVGIGLSTCLGGPVWLGEVAQDTKRRVMALLAKTPPFRGPLLMMPREAVDLQGSGLSQIVTPSVLASLPLSRDFEKMRRQMRGKWRNRLVVAEQSDLLYRDEQGTAERIAYLLTLEADQRKARGYKGLPLPFIQTLARADPKDMRLFSARHQGDLCAMMLHLRHGNSASYLVGWSDENGRRTHTHNLLMWHAMQFFAQRGVTHLDLGTLNTVAAPGLARFKLGTGAKACPMGGAWATVLPRWPFQARFGLKSAPDKA